MPSPDPFEIHFAERSLEQAKFAFEKFMAHWSMMRA
jgi:hypothetical protein